MRRNVAFALITACLLAAFALGFAASAVVGETYGGSLFSVLLAIAATIVVIIGLGSRRVFATLSGFGVGLLTPLMYYEGRWVAF
jgi:hypothetical protein